MKYFYYIIIASALVIVFFRIIRNWLYNRKIELVNTYLEGKAEELKSCIEILSEFEDIDLSPPSLDEETIPLAFEARYSLMFFVDLYALRRHNIVSIEKTSNNYYFIIPVKSYNEELILLVYRHNLINQFESNVIRGQNTRIPNWEAINKQVNEYCPSIRIISEIYSEVVANHFAADTYGYAKCQEAMNSLNNICLSYHNQLYASYISSDYPKIKFEREYRLYKYIKYWYTDSLYQFHSEWLGKQSLDILIPSKRIAIEYQGEQHYRPIKHFGGEEGYSKRLELDKKKKELCKRNKIKLYDWPYTEEVTFVSVSEFLKQNKNKRVFYSELNIPVHSILMKQDFEEIVF